MTWFAHSDSRRYEHKRLKDRLQVYYELMRDSLSTFERPVKSAKSKYLSEIINNNYSCPRTLFSTINSVLNPVVNVFNDLSETLCEHFLTFFVVKVDVEGIWFRHPWDTMKLCYLFLLWPCYSSYLQKDHWTFKTHSLSSWCHVSKL